MPRSTCKDQVPAFPGVSKVCSMDLGNTKLPVFPGVSKACTMTFTCIPGCFPACFSRDRSQMQADCLTTGEVPTAYSVKILSRTKGMASGSTTTSPLQVKGQSSNTQHKLFLLFITELVWFPWIPCSCTEVSSQSASHGFPHSELQLHGLLFPELQKDLHDLVLEREERLSQREVT